jgi:hypothetical protein
VRSKNRKKESSYYHDIAFGAVFITILKQEVKVAPVISAGISEHLRNKVVIIIKTSHDNWSHSGRRQRKQGGPVA